MICIYKKHFMKVTYQVKIGNLGNAQGNYNSSSKLNKNDLRRNMKQWKTTMIGKKKKHKKCIQTFTKEMCTT